MIDSFTIYWITRLDDIKELFSCFITLTGLPMIICFIIYVLVYILSKTDKKDYIRNFEILKIILIISVLFYVPIRIGYIFIPSSKEMCVIQIVPAIVNNQDLRDISKDSLKVAKKWILDNLNENCNEK